MDILRTGVVEIFRVKSNYKPRKWRIQEADLSLIFGTATATSTSMEASTSSMAATSTSMEASSTSSSMATSSTSMAASSTSTSMAATSTLMEASSTSSSMAASSTARLPFRRVLVHEQEDEELEEHLEVSKQYQFKIKVQMPLEKEEMGIINYNQNIIAMINGYLDEFQQRKNKLISVFG